MAVALVQSAIDAEPFSGDATMPVAFGSNVAANNLIVGAVTWDGNHTLSSVTDSQGNTYTLETVVRDGATPTVSLQVFHTIAGSSAACTVTATLSGNANRKAIVVHEVSGVQTTAGYRDKYAGQSQSNPGTGSNAVTSGSVTTTTDGQYIFGATGDPGYSTGKTQGTGYTLQETDGVMSILTSEDQVQTSAGSIAATFTIDGFAVISTAIATFKAAGGGGGGSATHPGWFGGGWW